jgi:hypothetical protein
MQIAATHFRRGRNRIRALAGGIDAWTIVILFGGGALAAHAAACQSVTHDESAHVPAGLAYWQFGAFDVYPHNPPLVKMCLSLPLFASGLRLEPAWLLRHPGPRYEWLLGQQFLRAHYTEAQRVYFRCRLVSVAFFLWGGWMIAGWSRELFSKPAGRVGAALWCFQPLVLAHASLATPDLGAAVLGLAATRALTRHFKHPSWRTAIFAGVFLGMAQLSNYTLLVLYIACAAMALISLVAEQRGAGLSRMRRAFLLLNVVLVSAATIWAGYGFVGIGQPQSMGVFISKRAQVLKSLLSHGETPLGARLPAILPRGYIEGLDRQWADVEHGWGNYFHGEVSNRGWWYYYIAALAMKTPLTFWALSGMAAWAAWRGCRGALSDEAALLLVPLLVVGLLQANTSLTFFRYLLPAVPFVCISVSRVVAPAARPRALRCAAICCLVPTVALPVLQHPGYLGYFNLAVGGPLGAWPWFTDGDIDWGQGLPALRQWQAAHPEARPMRVALFSALSPPYPGLIDDTPNRDDGTMLRWRLSSMPRVPTVPLQGYLAVSVTLLNRTAAGMPRPSGRTPEERFCRWLKARRPLALVGSSILIFHFSSDDVKAWAQISGGKIGDE